MTLTDEQFKQLQKAVESAFQSILPGRKWCAFDSTETLMRS